MPFVETGFPGLKVFEPRIFVDERGYFFESYNRQVFEAEKLSAEFVQDNQSSSTYGVVRGLHYQLAPFAQTKLVRVLQGKILDVAVDIRKGSPTYGKVYMLELSAEKQNQLYIPIGFAHGFSVLSDTAVVMYKCDNFYNKEAEAGISINDPDLVIDWRIPFDQQIISLKDRELPKFADCKNNFVFEEVPL